MRRRFVALTMVSLMFFGAAACGGSSDQTGGSDSGSAGASVGASGSPSSGQSSQTSTTGEIPGLSVSGKVGSKPQVKLDTPLKTDQTTTEVLTKGSGAPVVKGENALLQLTVVNGKTGKTAASTYDQGTPANVSMSDGQIFPALLDALVGTPQGSRVALASTVKQTYGKSGAQQLGLGPQDSVVFIVDVVSVPPTKVLDGPQGKQVKPPSGLPTVESKDGDVTGLDFSGADAKAPKKLEVIPLVKGDGPPARAGSLVTFDYFGEVWGAKKPFDESYSKQPVTFPLGVGQLIKAWDQGLVGVNRGSRVMIVAPPKYGYGSSGNPQAGIKGTDTLVFVVDILGVDG